MLKTLRKSREGGSPREIAMLHGVMKFALAILCLFISPLALSTPAYAEQMQIYTVDIQKVLETSIAGKAARNDIEAEVKKRQAKIDTERAKFQSLQKNTQKQIALLSADAAEEKQELLRKKEREFARLANDMKQEVDTIKDRKLGKIVEEIDNVISDLSEDKNYPLVMEKDPRVVLYVNSAYDITEAVITELNRKKLDL